MKTIQVRVEDDFYECLRDFAHKNGYGKSVAKYLVDIGKEHVMTKVGGYLLYVRRRSEWYKTHLEDYVETPEYCRQWNCDFNNFAGWKKVEDHTKLKKY